MLTEKQQEAELIAHEAVSMCLKALRRKSSPVRIRADKKPDVRLSWNCKRRRSWGGSRYVSLALSKYVGRDNEVSMFKEYSSFADQPAIGSVMSGDWRFSVKLVVCHEMAHFAAHIARSISQAGKPTTAAMLRKPHGEGFRRIYAYLRRELNINRDVREMGGFLGRSEIEQAKDLWEKSRSLLQPVADKKGQHHFSWAGEKRLKIAPRRHRGRHERLCDKRTSWSLTPPTTPIMEEQCWECFLLALKIGQRLQQEAS